MITMSIVLHNVGMAQVRNAIDSYAPRIELILTISDYFQDSISIQNNVSIALIKGDKNGVKNTLYILFALSPYQNDDDQRILLGLYGRPFEICENLQ